MKPAVEAMPSQNIYADLPGRTVLLVCGDWPWPPNYAARIDALDRIAALKKLGLEIDLLVTAAQHHGTLKIAELSGLINTCYVVQRRSGASDMLGRLTTGTEYSRRLLAEIELQKSYDFLIMEGHYVSYVLRNPSLKARHRIIRINNDERRYFAELSRSSKGIAKIYYLLEALRFRKRWPEVMKAAPIWLFSSADEHAKFEYLAEQVGAKSVFMPPHVDIAEPVPAKNNGKQVLFLGGLLMPNNIEALQWYLKNVHPSLLDIDGYCLCIAGNMGPCGSSALIDALIAGVASIRLVANPVETHSLYQDSAVFINPMRNGAGIKLKTIHALAAGVPVVATDVGAEGTLMRHKKEILQTNDPREFAQYIRMLLNDADLGLGLVSGAHKMLTTHYHQVDILGSALQRALNLESS